MIKSKIKAVVIGLMGCFFINYSFAQDNYQLPVGVPDPISTWVSDDYKGELADVIHPISGVAPESWEVANKAGDPAYYIDNTSPNATNKNNPFGSPDLPRLSFPDVAVYGPGSYVEFHGGPYGGTNQVRLTANGTADKPVWFRGVSSEDKPTFLFETIIKGQYVFLENLKFTELFKSIQLRPHQGSTLHHAVVRNVTMKGSGEFAGKNSSAIMVYGESPDNRFHDIVIYNNDISYFGDSYSDDAPEDGGTVENDYHGIGVANNVDRVWVLKNDIHHMGGDSIQVGFANGDDANRVDNVYVGDNDFHDNLENGVDVKEANNTLITSNKIYNFFQHNGNLSTGIAVVIHNDALNTWLVNNKIYNAATGIEHTGGLDVWIVGNVIDSINHPSWSSWSSSSVYSRGAGIHLRGVSTGGVVNNTIVKTDEGITMASGGQFLIANNIIYNRNEETGHELHSESNNSLNTVINNLIFHDNFNPNLKNVTCNSCLFSNPSFLDENYQTSIDASGVGAGYAFTMVQSKFKDSFGQSLDMDIVGGERIKGAIDIGAIENQDSSLSSSNTNTDIILPTAPSIVEITVQ